MYELNDKIRNLKPYDPISGEYQIRLDANESFLPIPEDLRAEILQRIDEAAWNRYPDPTAAGVCRAFGAYYGVPEECIAAGNGSDELIGVIVSGFAAPGESITVVSPDFSRFLRMFFFLLPVRSGRWPCQTCGQWHWPRGS